MGNDMDNKGDALVVTPKGRWRDGLVTAAAVPFVWGAAGAALTLLLLPMVLGKQPAPPGTDIKLATVDIAKIMQEYQERALRNPSDEASVATALEDSARAADQVDPLLKYLSTEVHPGYTLIQPQALAYQSTVPDFTDEFRVLVQKRSGKYNKGLEGYDNKQPPITTPTRRRRHPQTGGRKPVGCVTTLLLSLAVGLVWGWVLLWVIAHYQVSLNETDSLPDKFFVVGRGYHTPVLGEEMAFRVGEGVRHYPIGMTWVKRVAGVPGDKIEWHGDVVSVGGKAIGKALATNRYGEAMARVPAGVIPAGHYFVTTPHPASYDSRYADIGLISDQQVVGKVIW